VNKKKVGETTKRYTFIIWKKIT